jgi:hypothetical protein
MGDRRRYDSAMFWLAFGTAAAVIGLALMTIGVARTPSGSNLLASLWFDFGAGLLTLGGLLLLWALGLYLARRRDAAHDTASPPNGSDAAPAVRDSLVEAVRGYYAERSKLFDMWDRQQRRRPPKK